MVVDIVSAFRKVSTKPDQSQFFALEEDARRIQRKAEGAGELSTALAAIRELARLLELAVRVHVIQSEHRQHRPLEHVTQDELEAELKELVGVLRH